VTIPWSTVEKSVQNFFNEDGSLLMLQATKCSQSHAVTELAVQTSKASYMVSGEYDVRKLLSPRGCSIIQKDGNCVEGGSLLPSAYFSMEVNRGEDITLTGAGYGHGVGMSQNAANEMAKEGYSYEEILNYFFRNIELSTQ
jgi:stage II sporulation protein D